MSRYHTSGFFRRPTETIFTDNIDEEPDVDETVTGVPVKHVIWNPGSKTYMGYIQSRMLVGRWNLAAWNKEGKYLNSKKRPDLDIKIE